MNEIIILDLDNVTEEQLVDAIEKNNRTITMLQKNIDLLQTKSSVTNKMITNKSKTTPLKSAESVEEQLNQDNDVLGDEIEYYYSMINSYCDYDNLLSDIITSIPSKKNSNYSNIMLGIKLKLLREIKEFEELLELGSQEEGLTKSDLQEFVYIINLNKNKIDILTQIENKKEIEDELENVENNLIFVPTSGGNIRIIDEILDMPIEFLEGFRGLIDSIKDGTFKNVKKFDSTNSKNAGMCEVKDYKIRVVFDRIGRNDYALITAFIKKCDNDKGYLESMNLKIKNYIEQKDKIKANLSNPEFRKLHEGYTKDLYRILGGEVKQAPTYKIGGVSNV